MKNIPTLVKVAIGFILAGAGVWLVLGVLIAARLHQGMPSDPLIRWGMAIAAFVAFLVMGTLAWLLAKRKRLPFFITLVALGVVFLLTLFDQVGWADAVMMALTVAPFVLLVIGRKWFLQKSA